MAPPMTSALEPISPNTSACPMGVDLLRSSVPFSMAPPTRTSPTRAGCQLPKLGAKFAERPFHTPGWISHIRWLVDGSCGNKRTNKGTLERLGAGSDEATTY